jgi:hypothetical protein
MASSGSCIDLKINIASEQFIIACYGLSLGSYEMILGVQWLESLGPVLWAQGMGARYIGWLLYLQNRSVLLLQQCRMTYWVISCFVLSRSSLSHQVYHHNVIAATKFGYYQEHLR